jgi:2'-5' RNA ligase
MRSFIGLSIPEPMLGNLSSIAAGLASLDTDRMSWVGEQNYHLTLLFLGDQSPQWLEEYAQALDEELFFEEQYLSVSHILPFPEGSPKLLAAMVNDTGALKELYQNVKKIAVKLGFKPEKKRFMPHITLARKFPRQGRQIIPPALDKIEAYATELIIYESQLHQDGARYFPLYGLSSEEFGFEIQNLGLQYEG